MKCPKCGYLGFEPVDRCRNCGYDFSLARPLVLSELPIRTETPVAPLDDLTLIDAWSSRKSRQVESDGVEFDADLGRAVEQARDGTSTRSSLPLSLTGELPLFAPSTGEEGTAVKSARQRIPAKELVTSSLAGPPAPPARAAQREPVAGAVLEPLPPLGVRREIPGAGRLGTLQSRPQPLDLNLESFEATGGRRQSSVGSERRETDPLERDRARFSSRRPAESTRVEAEAEASAATYAASPYAASTYATPASTASASARLASASPSMRDAGLGARFVAVAIDLLLLAIVDAAVVYFTLAICGLSLAEIGLLPIGPLLAFLLGQNLGYLIVFNAGGQTIGKMTTGIKVVAEETGSTLSLGGAILRTFIWFVLAVPAGLGFLTALVSHDHRGLHDRFAGTRVVRASA